MPPKGIGVDVAEIIDVRDVRSAGVAAPGLEVCADVRSFFRKAALDPTQEIDPIRVVVAGDEFAGAPRADVPPGRSMSRSIAARVVA